MKPSGSAGKAGQPGYIASNNPALLLDKLNGRRSTPDSEALASSDDEIESHRQIPLSVVQRPARRASWLNDNTQPLSQPRKGSFASSSMSPTTSHPSTPSADTGPWATHGPPSAGASMARGSTSFPWGTGIWNPGEPRKEPPSRLTEVLPSQMGLPMSISSGTNIHGTGRGNVNHDGTIPFAIPLHPTPKTYRSQSYSVGQLESDTSAGSASPVNSSIVPGLTGRGRSNPHSSGLQHRPSRPSMLSEMSSDITGLGKVKEVDDDEEAAPNSSPSDVQLDQAKVLEELARENAILRQQNIVNARLRSQSSTQQHGSGMYMVGNTYGDSDYAIDELDEVGDLQDRGSRHLARRLSEFSAAQGANSLSYNSVENRKLENVKKAYWQSSLGFGGLEDIPQSRRHSFADVPSRHGSMGSVGEAVRDIRQDVRSPQGQHGVNMDQANYPGHDHAASYFGGSSLLRNADPFTMATYPPAAYNAYANNQQYSNGRATSPHRNMYGVPQPRQNQLLYMVLFKCSRADVFYVQEGTGLSVKPGDLVIVEADRGTDLGTVAQENVDWAQAKELKEHYAEEHYKWLMMYSQGAAGTADGTGAGLMAASNGLQGSAVGGMGPPNQHNMQEPSSGELKPKIIKRLAQAHEIQALRDKEGNEAKAKRVCMQKVKEHGLHMEILDAEFQMDWKKLTFYYFADAYINFNSLVTDLFKVYKTRIWMSAINPASFATPSLGLQAPSGIGPGAVGVNRPTQVERRSHHETPAYGSITPISKGYIGGMGNTFGPSVDSQMSPAGFSQGSYSSYGYSTFANPRAAATSLASYPTADPYSTFGSQGDYQTTPQRFTHGAGLNTAEYLGQSNNPPSNDTWMNAMQGLSLNSR